MLPVDFPERNFTYTKPKGWTDEQCSDLQVWRGTSPLEGGGMTATIISCWQPSKEDIEAINAGKPIFLKILSAEQPPVEVTTENPFIHQD
jgi:hypothetical protein